FSPPPDTVDDRLSAEFLFQDSRHCGLFSLDCIDYHRKATQWRINEPGVDSQCGCFLNGIAIYLPANRPNLETGATHQKAESRENLCTIDRERRRPGSEFYRGGQSDSP
ncbi:MAG: hypothetical protein J07HR59_00413, partial [Halorubrum sp. J07HR59]